MKKMFVLGAMLVALVAFQPTESFAQKKGKWVTLFDGKSFDNWKRWKGGEINKWAIEDGAMVLTEKGGGDLLTVNQYGDFELELEWKISEGGNSGVMYHVQEGEKYCCPYATGPEVQVLDDVKHPDSFAGKDGNHKSGSLYDMIPPNDLKVVKPAGEWNKMRIVVNDGKAQHYLNGKKVVEYSTTGPEWNALVANSKFKTWNGFGAFDKGHIALQDHGDKVWYRNIRIREL
ncbi:DUF1080 domain-containing protein [Telluribacter humicola]